MSDLRVNIFLKRIRLTVVRFIIYLLIVSMSNVNIDNVFSEYVLKAIQGINIISKLRPDNHIIFYYVVKNFATDVDTSLIDATIQILLSKSLIENRPTNKVDPFFIKHASSDFHEVNCKEKTKNFKNVAQVMQTSAPLNNIYVSNDAFDAFYVNYIKFEKFVDHMLIH